MKVNLILFFILFNFLIFNSCDNKIKITETKEYLDLKSQYDELKFNYESQHLLILLILEVDELLPLIVTSNGNKYSETIPLLRFANQSITKLINKNFFSDSKNEFRNNLIVKLQSLKMKIKNIEGLNKQSLELIENIDNLISYFNGLNNRSIK